MSVLDPKLVFVYNADSGLFEAMTDAIRKVVAPMTQNCNLCALTYQVAWMKPVWSSFVNHLGARSMGGIPSLGGPPPTTAPANSSSRGVGPPFTVPSMSRETPDGCRVNM